MSVRLFRFGLVHIELLMNLLVIIAPYNSKPVVPTVVNDMTRIGVSRGDSGLNFQKFLRS